MPATLHFESTCGTFARKTQYFDHPSTITLDGDASDTLAPASTNLIFPSFALAIDQALIHYDGSSFALKSVSWHSDSICVDGTLLGDHTHTLADGDLLQFGRYRPQEHSFEIDCAVLVRLLFSASPTPAPTTTNWPGVRKLIAEVRNAQTQSPQDRHPKLAPQSESLPSSVPSSVLSSSTSSSAPISSQSSSQTATPSSTSPPASASTSVLSSTPPQPQVSPSSPSATALASRPTHSPSSFLVPAQAYSSRTDGLSVALERFRQGWLVARRALMVRETVVPSPVITSRYCSSDASARDRPKLSAIERVQQVLLALLQYPQLPPPDSVSRHGHACFATSSHPATAWSATSTLPVVAPATSSGITHPHTHVGPSPSIGLPAASMPASWSASTSVPPVGIPRRLAGSRGDLASPRSSIDPSLHLYANSSSTPASAHYLLSRLLALCDQLGPLFSAHFSPYLGGFASPHLPR
ncbi:hypothetical protein CF319_g9203 [Tilletia indica]|nr:hypothetical protein CF319_g9203 [Tilletia indica]